ncbi:hypothetical protein GU90_09900 [Saccharopolyspora rectivirgula]|jgi:hypothetical protein|uniref:Uncharacterized protein n=1 Tax=Saccharopolyspora rectivirgula TaxID=28042 RepID=A0A073AXF5_9PSEU|nr:hypothetical protein GU90_09900 [Saccharopolyspora rectivirgula]
MRTHERYIWTHGPAGLVKAKIRVEYEEEKEFFRVLLMGDDVPAVQSPGRNMFRALMGLRLQLEDIGPWKLLIAAARYDAWDGIPGYPCPRTRVRLYPFGQPPTEPVHALEHTQDPNVLAVSVQESLMWRFQWQHNTDSWSRTFGAQRQRVYGTG